MNSRIVSCFKTYGTRFYCIGANADFLVINKGVMKNDSSGGAERSEQ